MTTRDVLRAVLRRWYVVLAALLCVASLTILFYRDGGSFATRTILTFTFPAQSTLSPESGSTDTSVIAFASAVATEINNGNPTPSYSSADAPFYGAGIRQGVIVGLRNEGGQWVASYPSATIEIQIVGRTYEWVKDTQERLLADVQNTAIAQQNAASATENERIAVTVEPLTTSIESIVPSRTSVIAAALAMLLVGLIVGVWGAIALDALVARRTLRHRAQAQALPRPYSQLEGSTA